MNVLLGAIADDFTGATDLANTLLQNGMRTVQVVGVPETDVPLGDAEAVVVALKSRTAPEEQAVEESVAPDLFAEFVNAKKERTKQPSVWLQPYRRNSGG